ncbi:hypothetical protein [Microtetraspora fusca]|uniref:hypothetical protein n=1 Tax=Microtetraspora fusca TaxID=1997 RepID=UPI000A80F24E|nr:hypothetical protein [Microtetraspora fusca]
MSTRWLAGAAATMAAAALLLPSPASASASGTRSGGHAVPGAPAAARTAPAAPATVAKRLFGAWLRRDRAAAARVASPSAVNTLFSYVYRAPDGFAGCTGNRCRFTHTSVRVPGGLNGILMIVSGTKVNRVYESRHLTRPSTAAAYLFSAWQKGDRDRGLEVASTAAVSSLFRTKYDPAGVTYYPQGCTAEPKGFSCAYSYEGGAMLMHVTGTRSSGYEVRSISYIAD